MSFRLHPTKNKHLKPGEPRYYQFDMGWSKHEERVTVVKQFTSDKEAQLYDNELKRAARPPITSIIAPTFDKILPDFLEWYKTNRRSKSLSAWLSGWRNLAPHFSQLKPNHLTPALIDQYKSYRLAQKAGIRKNLVCKRTVQKELNNLSAIIRFAVDRHLCNPLTFKIVGFPRSQTIARKKIIPTPGQIEAMLLLCRSDVRPLYQLIYYTGIRNAEARTLTVGQVDLERDLILVMGKGGRDRLVPIISRLRPILEKLTKDRKPEEILMLSHRTGKPYTNNIGRLERVAVAAGITQRMNCHMLRHCFGTHCIYWGLDIRTVQMLLGHADVSTTQIYTTLAGTFLTQEMRRFGGTPTEPAQKAQPE